MSDRIRLLEDALAILQSTATGPGGEPHPLLHRDLLAIKSSIDLHAATHGGSAEDGLDVNEGGQDAEEQYIDAFGTLALHDDGAATFYGRSAGSEVIFSYFNLVFYKLILPYRTVTPHCKHSNSFILLTFFHTYI